MSNNGRMRFRLRTLLILLAVLPPLIWFGWAKYEAWKAEQDREQARQEQVMRARTDHAARQKAIDRMLAAESAKVEANMEAARAELAKKAERPKKLP